MISLDERLIVYTIFKLTILKCCTCDFMHFTLVYMWMTDVSVERGDERRGRRGGSVRMCLHLVGREKRGKRESGLEGEEKREQCGRLRTEEDNSQCFQNCCE